MAAESAERMAAMGEPEPTPGSDVPLFTPTEWVRPRNWTWSDGSGWGS